MASFTAKYESRQSGSHHSDNKIRRFIFWSNKKDFGRLAARIVYGIVDIYFRK
jgi:hypothetical protein